MSIEKLEKEYTITIKQVDGLYHVFNFFGELWFVESSLENIDKEMRRIYKMEDIKNV